MKTLAFIFAYNRAETLRECIRSVYESSDFKPDWGTLIDDGSTDPKMAEVIDGANARYGLGAIRKPGNYGLSHSAVMALKIARETDPDFVFFIEGDYVFNAHGLDMVMDALANTDEGRNCLGIAGYDHPNQGDWRYTQHVFPACMKAQVGDDNVNRDALYRPEIQFGSPFRYSTELVSNTCWTSYLNWRNIQKVAAEFPELNDLLDQACAPRENPNYPDSGKYRKQGTVDDGMLSHALSLCWNRYAIKHGLDRDRLGAWLNIKPSVAEHRFQGGTNFN